jgi:hypothetical protein
LSDFCDEEDDFFLNLGIDLDGSLSEIEAKTRPMRGKKLKKKRKRVLKQFVEEKYGGKPGPAWRDGKGCKSCNPAFFDRINKCLLEGRSYKFIDELLNEQYPRMEVPSANSISRHHKHHTDILIASEEICGEIAGIRTDIRRMDIKINTIEEIEKTILDLNTRIEKFNENFTETGIPDKNEIPFLKEKTRLLMERDKAIERSMENKERNKALMVGEICSIMMVIENRLGGPEEMTKIIQILKNIKTGHEERERGF